MTATALSSSSVALRVSQTAKPGNMDVRVKTEDGAFISARPVSVRPAVASRRIVCAAGLIDLSRGSFFASQELKIDPRCKMAQVTLRLRDKITAVSRDVDHCRQLDPWTAGFSLKLLLLRSSHQDNEEAGRDLIQQVLSFRNEAGYFAATKE